MKSVLVIITNWLPQNLIFERLFCNNFGRDGSLNRSLSMFSRTIRIARFWIARFTIQNRRFSATKPVILRHRIWPGEGSTVQWKWSPPAPGSLKAPLLPPLLNNVQTRERKGYERDTARNFLHSFPLSSTPVVQSYWAWKSGVSDRRLGIGHF